MDLLDAEGSAGLSMRKLSSALQVSLPTIYAAVSSRNALVQDVLRAALAREVRAVGASLEPGGAEPSAVLAAMVDATSGHPWLHELAQELDTGELLSVSEGVVGDTRPSVIDELAARLGAASGRPAGAVLEPAQLLFLVVLLLDDVARLVAAGRCPANRQGQLGQALLRTMLEPVDEPAAGALGERRPLPVA
jgi:AcrR family transcriptional regulator